VEGQGEGERGYKESGDKEKGDREKYLKHLKSLTGGSPLFSRGDVRRTEGDKIIKL